MRIPSGATATAPATSAAASRFCFGLAESDPALVELENRLAVKPKIVVPAVTLDSVEDPLKPGGRLLTPRMFVDHHEHRTIKAGHDLPHEALGALPQPC